MRVKLNTVNCLHPEAEKKTRLLPIDMYITIISGTLETGYPVQIWFGAHALELSVLIT